MIKLTKFTNPSKPTKPTKPTKPSKPTKSSKPSTPVKPVKPTPPVLDKIASVLEPEVVVKQPVPMVRPKLSPGEFEALAYELINGLLTHLEAYELDRTRIENHPTISNDSKSDISHYINKNIVSTVHVLSPAFPLLKDYERTKQLKALHTRSINKGAPGIFAPKKHI